MEIKSIIAKQFAKYIASKIRLWKRNPIHFQDKTFAKLIHDAKYTLFGKDHHFSKINNYEDFKKNVPIRDYEALKPYIERVKNGENDILWVGKPAYFAKTSGTTSGTKYIPITKEAIKFQVNSARNALLSYINETGKTDFVNGKMIFLQGSPEMTQKNGIYIGRLSGIVAHFVPKYLQNNRLPSLATNCIDDWESKVDAIVEETFHQNMTLISGIPPWLQMYFNKLSEKSNGKLIKDIFKNFSLMVYGGVNFEPYRTKMEASIGKKIDAIETYPASEGFIAFQDQQSDDSMLLLVDNGIFYEFIRASEYFDPNPSRLSLEEVELGVNYALILNTNAGLWGYSIGDTVKFTSLFPHKIKVTGRIKHFISAFGEHVIGEEVEFALKMANNTFQHKVVEFTVAPQVNSLNGELPFHEWLIAFEEIPVNLQEFAQQIDSFLQQKNSYYFDLIEGKVLQPLKITPLPKDAFVNYMKIEGKLGGQNKMPRLSNDRKIADALRGLQISNE